MKRSSSSTVSSSAVVTNTRKTDMSQLGKMFVYIALMELKNRAVYMDGELSTAAGMLAMKLCDIGVVTYESDGSVDGLGGNNIFVLTEKGKQLLPRYLAACADELRTARFGKMKWDKRSKFHKALMERLA